MDTLPLTILTALSLISILILISVGMAIIFGMMNVINLAHGEFVMLGAYVAVIAAQIGGFWLALAIAPLLGAGFGILLESTIIRLLYRRPIDTIIATLGVSLVVQKLVELWFGSSPYSVMNPLPGLVDVFGTPYPLYRIFVIGCAAAVLLLGMIAYRSTNFGLNLRAAIQDPEMARAMGVDVAATYRIAFGLGAGLAALAGVLVAPLTSIFPGMGLAYLIRSFFVVIVGGTGSIGGVLAGSAFIGFFESFFSFRLGGAFPQAIVLALAIIVVRLRPKGLVSG